MNDKTREPTSPTDAFSDLMRRQSEGMMTLFGAMAPDADQSGAKDAVHWAEVVGRMQSMLVDFQVEQLSKASTNSSHFSDPAKWVATAESVMRQLPLASPESKNKIWSDSLELFETVLGQFGIGPRGEDAANASGNARDLPRSDRRFNDPAWREQPFFAVLHQAYLMMAEHLVGAAQSVEGMDPARKRQLVFATKMLVDSISPSNFPLLNPVALDKAVETKGESLVKGMENLLADLRRGQLTHTNPTAFTLGENIAVTPGKVVYETDLFQLIQYTPTTAKVLEVPLIIFPPWINRFYILDLNAKKSFVRWAVEQGVSVFMVSWKSADASMADIVWDDYIAAQVEAIDHVCARLKVPSAHTIGYCVAGTTLAATLAILAKKGEAQKVASATFFTAQVDFSNAGDLLNFVDDQQIETIGYLSPEGYLDGRYLAATFNLLRGNDLVWTYVEKNYLKGEEYPAFDLLHWNGDVTNLPLRWHREYLSDLYRDNRLVVPNALSACGVGIDLSKISTPCYIQAGREDHIAPPESVWKLTHHLKGRYTFLLAGSGHIAGVVNPPSANKYGYWTNDEPVENLNDFIAGASEHSGSWWPHWREWLESIDDAMVPVKGKRRPGGRGDKTIEDAPGRYVAQR
ncbi:PHA/PHB synthase family protein [Novosphingobium aquimarinum]|uniref:PHA/PHB synthase family protein n=1 Tax=Novosphingobium aquimarinum TaxID=2682494 RepID=UPI0012EBB7E5|nr:alpha/beta fold hydrolase [Novosphingobium aquimarinum]